MEKLVRNSSGWQVCNQQEIIGARDKIQPSLLDRLTDDQPQEKSEPLSSNLISHNILRRHVLRDLQWLFNTINHDSPQVLAELAQVRRSVVNFGVASLAGKRMSDIEWQDIQHKLTEAIINFEPRILQQGLQVRCISDTQSLDLHNVLSIEIKGRLWGRPYPLEFLFRTEVDLENGHFELKDVG
ncbi:type VI secretion system baseplate subunit TssE [Serratia sp. N21D137]|uniref:type VI secretion system baseplate subunit TssE n=1 Tax=Serratia sp. N21D137 TaxID=3397495 RepID=UPI0039E0F249